MEEKSGLTGVRLRAPHSTLEKIASAAARAGWTQSHFDLKGRLVLSVPPNYTPENFGQLLQALDAYKSDVEGLQMLGPHGGPVDDQGVEHPDE